MDLKEKQTTRNVKGYLLSEVDVLQLLIPELPEDSKILGVQWKAEYLGFLVAVENKEFEPVKPGVQIPVEAIHLKKEL